MACDQRQIHLAVIPATVSECSVLMSFSDEDADDLSYLLPATEYLMYEVARRSALGFEQALDKLREGAMDWRTRKGNTDG